MADILGNNIDGATHFEYSNGNYIRDHHHKYIVYAAKPLEGCLPLATYEVCRSYHPKVKNSRQEWKKDKETYVLHYEDITTKAPKQSKPTNYKIISDSIRNFSFFHPEKFDLPYKCCNWLDCATNMKVTFHKKSDNNTPWINFYEGSIKEHFGEDFPIKPSLQREGHLFSTFLPPLLRRIIKKRHEIIDNSQNAFQDDFIFSIKDLITDCISLLDITLNSLYIKAQYTPPPKWNFDSEKLGSRINRRMNDKLRWVYQITRNSLDIESERAALENFRILRNHFAHFDPPSFVITLEEITTILNQVMEIGVILIKIRQALGTISSMELINFILQKQVQFNFEPEFSERVPLNRSTDGYLTSVWPNTP